MWVFIIILILVALIAAYPVVRDYIKRKKTLDLSYTEGLSLMLDGNDDEAITKFKATVVADSNNVDAYLRLTELFCKKGDTERAVRIFERLMLRKNMSIDEEKKVYRKLADYYLKTDRVQRAITILEELINIDRTNITHYEQLLALYCKTDRWSDCDELLQKIEKIHSNKERLAEYFTGVGKKLYVKNSEDAAKYFKQALAYNRKSIGALFALGDYYNNRKETELAIKIWNELLEYYPQHNYLVRSRLEQAYYDLGQFEEVVDLYEKLLKKAPGDTGLYIALAQIYEKKEDINTAIRILAKIPAEKKREALPQIELAKLYLKNGDTNKAKQVLETTVEQLKEKGSEKS